MWFFHFWPFDGFSVPAGKSVIAEVSPALCEREYPARQGMTGSQHDAYAIASWLRQADGSGACMPLLPLTLTAARYCWQELKAGFLGRRDV